MHATEVGVIEQAKRLCGKFTRINTEVDPKQIGALDDTSCIEELESLGRSVARREFESVKETFLKRKSQRSQ